MRDDGTIVELSEAEHAQLLKERELARAEGRRHFSPTPITPSQATFFRTKGIAFREIWGKRLARGLTVDQKHQLDSMVLEFESLSGNHAGDKQGE